MADAVRYQTDVGMGYRLRRRLTEGVVYLILLVVSIESLYPMVMMVINSFKTDSAVLVNPVGLPSPPTLVSYQTMINYHSGIAVNFWVSTVVSVSSTVLAVLFAAMAGYALAKYRFRGRDAIFAALLATLMVPGEITIPGLYVLFARLHWLNTYQVQILPAIPTVFGLFLIRQYMLDIPDALLEAARIDGAGHWQTFTQIMLPAAAPILGALAILQFLGTWNSYLWPLLVANDPSIEPIMVVLPSIHDTVVGFFVPWGTVMAGSVLATLPLVAIFLIFQNWFLSGVVIGAVKE
ncbi:MAG: carbohydrate ABC transporter permease [Chloroflexota bacterium]